VPQATGDWLLVAGVVVVVALFWPTIRVGGLLQEAGALLPAALPEDGLVLVAEDRLVLLPGVTAVDRAVPGAVWLVEATELPELVVVFCVSGVLLTLPALVLLPQHSQPASVRPATTIPEQAISFFKPMSFPLPQKRVYARPATCGPSPQPHGGPDC
jgi:hypothetical protein